MSYLEEQEASCELSGGAGYKEQEASCESSGGAGGKLWVIWRSRRQAVSYLEVHAGGKLEQWESGGTGQQLL